MYLLTLHQRYSSFAFMFEISENMNDDKKISEINKNITKFQLESCFYVVSEERIYQNLYSKLSETLDIEGLFFDIKEINERFKSISDDYNDKRERNKTTALTGITLLSVCSCFADISGFLDRFFGEEALASTIISGSVVAVVGILVILFYKYLSKKL